MMSFDSVNLHMTSQLGSLHLKETGMTPENKLTRLEIDNAYLSQQNEHLQRELSFARYTINALKTITYQKDTTLQDTKLELERAYLRIKMLGVSMMRQQQQDLIYQQQQQQQHHRHQYYQSQAGPEMEDLDDDDDETVGMIMKEEDKPMLIMDADSSDDQQELSDEEEQLQKEKQQLKSEQQEPQQVYRRPLSGIMAKLPLRQPTTIQKQERQQQQEQQQRHQQDVLASYPCYNL